MARIAVIPQGKAHDFTLVTADERQAALPLVRSTLVDR